MYNLVPTTRGGRGSLAGQQPGILHAPLSTAHAKYHQTGGALDSKSLIVRMKKIMQNLYPCLSNLEICHGNPRNPMYKIHKSNVKSTNPM